jgi:KDO2-lipid IV(A) lauroyltransferase
VAVLIDQHIQTADAVTVDFFDRPAATTSAVATLALRTGAALIPAFALPIAHGRYRLVYEHPVAFPAENVSDPVQDLTQRCTDVLEMYVRRHPELWLWMHRRWRDLPASTGLPGMFPAASADETGDDATEVSE